MSANPMRGQIEAELGGAVRTLALPMERIAALEKDAGVGFFVFAGVVQRRQLTTTQLRDALYHGLLGGGWKPDPAQIKDSRGAVTRMMAAIGPLKSVALAAELISATLTVGMDDEEPEGNPGAGEDPAAPTSTG